MTQTVSDLYSQHVRDGHIEDDPAQRQLVRRLDQLVDALRETQLARKSNPLGWLFGRRQAKAKNDIRGLYIWGSVGRGKTMLMDLFFEVAPVAAKKRVHFHAFMADVHARVHAWRQARKAGTAKGEEPIHPIADDLADEATLLCFDEFSVTDIADAMLLGRLFEALFARGIIVVATSNVEPSRLYEGGLNRALFLPFIALLTKKMDVVSLDSRTDFRLEKLSGSPVYYVPADATARAAIDRMFKSLSGAEQGTPTTLRVLGRDVPVPEQAANVARFTFRDLCEKPLAAADYLAIAEHYHTVIVENIPVIKASQRNEAKRFINLIDTFYDRHVKLIASAEAEPHNLFLGREGREAFEFERTVSRLIEMRSEEYLALPHGHVTSEASGDTTGLIDT